MGRKNWLSFYPPCDTYYKVRYTEGTYAYG